MKITRVEKLTDERHVNLYAAAFEHNGHAGRWVYASRQEQPVAARRGDAVLIVPLLHAPGEPPRLVLIKEFRVPLAAYSYTFPAGLLEEGEEPGEAARREMLEETGLTVTNVKEVSPLLCSSAGLTDEAIYLVLVDAAQTPGATAQLDQSEEIETVLLDYDAVCRLCAESGGPLIDAKAWAVLYMYRRLGRLE